MAISAELGGDTTSSALGDDVHCPICSKSARGVSPAAVELIRCDKCRFQWIPAGHPFKDQTERWVHGYYDDPNTVAFHKARRTAMAAIARQIARRRPGRLRSLDVGAGIGKMLEVAKEVGWAAEGVEPNRSAADEARRTTGCTVHVGFFENLQLAAESYDVVTMFDTLRCTVGVLGCLESARRVLKRGGLLVIREANGDVLARARWTASNGLSRSCKTLESASDHQTFSPLSLRIALRRAGFEPLAIKPSPPYTERAAGDHRLLPLVKIAGFHACRLIQVMSAGKVLVSPSVIAIGRVPDEPSA